MPLTNSQHSAIMREYEERQNQSRRLQILRTDEIYDKIPAYAEADREVAAISVSQAHKLLEGDDNAVISLRAKLKELSSRKASLLTAAGYPADYLNLQVHCPDCKDTGYIQGQKCHCLRRRISSLLYEQSHISEVLQHENFSTLSDSYYEGEALDLFRAAVDGCHLFVNRFSSDYRNLFFFGSVGAGKTFLSNCIAKELLDQGQYLLYFSAAGLIDALGKESEEILQCDLLLIDDLGTEYPSPYAITQLFNCLNERHLQRKSTLISTNLSLEELRNRYSERIFSRIISFYDMYRITGPDIRLKKKYMSNRK